MTEMIERVARAIYDGELLPGSRGHILLPYNAMKDSYLILARAARHRSHARADRSDESRWLCQSVARRIRHV